MTSAHHACIDGSRAHRWRVETPQRGQELVSARCLRCGATRTYRAYLDEIDGHWRERPYRPPVPSRTGRDS